MAALSWLLIPLVAAVAAGIWGSWAGRRRTTTPDVDGVAGYERFRAAMERSREEEPGPAEEPRERHRGAAVTPAIAHSGVSGRPATDGPARAAD